MQILWLLWAFQMVHYKIYAYTLHNPELLGAQERNLQKQKHLKERVWENFTGKMDVTQSIAVEMNEYFTFASERWLL